MSALRLAPPPEPAVELVVVVVVVAVGAVLLFEPHAADTETMAMVAAIPTGADMDRLRVNEPLSGLNDCGTAV